MVAFILFFVLDFLGLTPVYAGQQVICSAFAPVVDMGRSATVEYVGLVLTSAFEFEFNGHCTGYLQTTYFVALMVNHSIRRRG